MKVTYQILTVLFWVIIGLEIFFVNMNLTMNPIRLPNDLVFAIAQIFGMFLGLALFPLIVYIIRYFVGRKLKASVQNHELE